MQLLGFHIVTIQNFRVRILGILMVVMCTGPLMLQAQESRSAESRLAFFEIRAQEDAAYEHAMKWKSEEDEIDFWTDQRNFEKELEKDYYQGYQVYIVTKRAAYIDFQNNCESHAKHGDYYQLQEAFYYQNGGPAMSEDVYIATSASH